MSHIQQYQQGKMCSKTLLPHKPGISLVLSAVLMFISSMRLNHNRGSKCSLVHKIPSQVKLQ